MSYSSSTTSNIVTEDYPLSHVFGNFPPNVIEDLCKGVAKREVELTALRNKLNVKSSSIEGLLLGPSQPLTMIGYEPKNTFSLGESGKAVIDGYHPEMGIAVEVEKGRIMFGNQLYLDLYKFIALDGYWRRCLTYIYDTSCKTKGAGARSPTNGLRNALRVHSVNDSGKCWPKGT